MIRETLQTNFDQQLFISPSAQQPLFNCRTAPCNTCWFSTSTIMNNGNNNISVEVELEIPFQDCDPMGVTWHGNYFRYLETARSALLNKIGYNYSQMKKTGYSWPIVDTRLKFLQPTRFSERIRITATLMEYENRMKIEYIIRHAKTGEATTRGYSIQVAVKADTNDMCFCSPEEFVNRVLAFGKNTGETLVT